MIRHSRNDITKRLPALAEACRGIRARTYVIDGELIGGDGDRLDLWSLQRVLGAGRADCISIVAFDLIHANGVDLRQRPLDARKERLARLVDVPGLEMVETFPNGVELLAAAERLGLEGVVSKRRDGLYRSGRSRLWVKARRVQWLDANRDRWKVLATK